MQKTIIMLACALLTLPTHAQPELKGTPNDLAQILANLPKYVSITGEGEIKKTADKAVLSLKISTENRSMQEAMRLNQDIRGKLMDYLKKQGLSADSVQAAKFSSTPQFGWFSEKAKSYHMENSVKVTVHDEKEFSAVSGALDKWSEVQFLGLEFEHSNKEELKKEAVAKACDNATERKKVYEEKFGVKLVVKKFSEDMGAQTSLRDRHEYARVSGGTMPSLVSANESSYAGKGGEDGGGISPFGELVYNSTVVVEYSVEPK